MPASKDVAAMYDEVEDLDQDEGKAPRIDDQDAANCVKILLATDNHVGFLENDPVRGQDSFDTFREILELAREHDVDFLLLAGDLFHENKPSRSCLHKVISLLREYTQGDKPIQIELLSDPDEGAQEGFSFPSINYEDPNLNISIPAFSIHGNHDDPQGSGPEGALSALDLLAASGVLNYFGKVDLPPEEEAADAADRGIKVKPVLLQKGDTKLAMFGIGNVKDQRMHFELRSNRVKMFRPLENKDEWFNMLLIHQNRVKHGPQIFVPENMFDDSIDLVVWGHEHDCRIEPEKIPGKNYYVTQPGSSVATSLAEGESKQKHVAVLLIQGKNFQINPIPLKTVRPFVLDEICLEEAADEEGDLSKLDLSQKLSITKYLRTRVEGLLKRAHEQWLENNPGANIKSRPKPLIRLKVETTGANDLTNSARFGQDFADRIANPRDILHFYRRKKVAEKKSKVSMDQPLLEELSMEGPHGMKVNKVEMQKLVKEYLQAQSLQVLPEQGLEDAVDNSILKDNKSAIKEFVERTLTFANSGLQTEKVDEETINDQVIAQKDKLIKEFEGNGGGGEGSSGKAKGKGTVKIDDDAMSVDSFAHSDRYDDMDEEEDEAPAARKKKVAAATTKKPAASSSRSRKQPLFDDEDDDEEEDDDDDNDDDNESLENVVTAKKARDAPAAKRAIATRAPAKKLTTTQPKLSFAPPARTARASKKINNNAVEVIDDSD